MTTLPKLARHDWVAAQIAATEVEQVTLTGNLAYTLPAGASPNRVHSVVFTQDATGGRTVTYGGTALTLDAAPNASTLVEFWPTGGSWRVVYPATLGGGGGGSSAITADDTPAAPAEGESASYLVTSAVSWPAGLVWSTDPDGGVAPTITGTALVSLFTLGGTTRAILGATFPGVVVPDTTNPTAGTLASSAITDTSFTLTASGAADAGGLHAQPYAFDDGSGTFGAWQASASKAATGKTAETAYTCRHKVRDAAGNESTGSSITVTTSAAAPPDTTAPTVGTMAATSITSSGFGLTVSGAADETALHATPYAFTTDGGTTWSAYQASNVLAVTGKAAGTGYSCNWRVRDAAGNVSTGTAQTVTTTAVPAEGGPYVWERRVTPEVAESVDPSGLDTTHTYTVAGTAGRLLVAGFSVDKAAGAITVSAGWNLVAYNSGASVSGALAWRVATGSDDITWTLGGGTARAACCDVHEFTGFVSPTVDVFDAFPDPADDTAKSSLAVTAGNATADGMAVAIAGQDTVNESIAAAQTVDSGYTMRSWNTGGGSADNSLLMATKNVSAGGSTAATFSFGSVSDQAFGIVAVFKG